MKNNNKTIKKILIMAGGTGGHVFPGLAVADILKQHGIEIAWLGTADGIEAKLVPAADIPLHTLSIQGVRGKAWIQKLLSPFKLIKAIHQAKLHLKKLQPDLVIGFGGFASGPGGIAAKWLHIPLVIHEQNAIAGMTNVVLSRLAKKVLQAFPHTFPKARQAITVGNPVRESLCEFGFPFDRFFQRKGGLHVLILGGSRGAQALNTIVPRACTFLPLDSIKIWHQTGTSDHTRTQMAYADIGYEARVDAFIDNMAEAYAWADVVLCRAGALTVFELAAVGVGSILVPFPYAVDDHQTKNAHYLVRHNAAVLMPQSELDSSKLAKYLRGLSRSHLQTQAVQAYSLRLPDSAKQVAKICMNLINES